MVGLTSARSWRQLATLVFEASRSGANWNDGRSHGWRSRIAAVVGLTAVGVGAATSEFGPLLANGDAAGPAPTTASSPRQWLRSAGRR